MYLLQRARGEQQAEPSTRLLGCFGQQGFLCTWVTCPVSQASAQPALRAHEPGSPSRRASGVTWVTWPNPLSHAARQAPSHSAAHSPEGTWCLGRCSQQNLGSGRQLSRDTQQVGMGRTHSSQRGGIRASQPCPPLGVRFPGAHCAAGGWPRSGAVGGDSPSHQLPTPRVHVGTRRP